MNPTKLKIVTAKEAQTLVNKWKKERLNVVFTNGCFDILHLGHVDYLEKSRNLGDKLIVAINDDESVRRLKGENRPINDLFFRSRVLAALDFVDAVIPFKEDTPLEVIRQLLPDILVKGSDYERSNIIGADVVEQNGGSVRTIDLVEGISTSSIVEKIKGLN